MADLTSSLVRAVKGAKGLAAQVSNSVQTYAGMWAGLRGPDHATSQGYLDSYDDEKGMIFVGGHLDDQKLGDTSASPVPENRWNTESKVYPQVTVATVTSRGDIGKAVYATDSDVLTLVRPTLGTPIGFVTEWHTGTTCDVLMLGLPAQAALDLSGQGIQVLHLGSFSFAGTGDADLLTSYPMPYHASIESFYCVVSELFVGSSGACTLNLEIGTADVTGGELTVATATCGTIGTVLTGAAITAANVVHAGDLLSVEGTSSATTRTSGRFDLYIKLAPRLGV